MEYDYVIEVEDDEYPHDVADDVFRDVLSDLDMFQTDRHITEMKRIPAGWDEQCFPYRSDGKTIMRLGERLKEINESKSKPSTSS
jgi:hypothetical protein